MVTRFPISTACSAFPGIDADVQNLEDFVTADAGIRDQYDALVFYNFHQATPTGEEQGWQKGIKPALEQLGQTAQGILVLHHALLAHRQWPLWSEVVGIADRGFGYYHDQTLHVEVLPTGCTPSPRAWGPGRWWMRRIQ